MVNLVKVPEGTVAYEFNGEALGIERQSATDNKSAVELIKHLSLKGMKDIKDILYQLLSMKNGSGYTNIL